MLEQMRLGDRVVLHSGCSRRELRYGDRCIEPGLRCEAAGRDWLPCLSTPREA